MAVRRASKQQHARSASWLQLAGVAAITRGASKHHRAANIRHSGLARWIDVEAENVIAHHIHSFMHTCVHARNDLHVVYYLGNWSLHRADTLRGS